MEFPNNGQMPDLKDVTYHSQGQLDNFHNPANTGFSLHNTEQDQAFGNDQSTTFGTQTSPNNLYHFNDQQHSNNFRSVSLGPQQYQQNLARQPLNQAKAATCSPNTGRIYAQPSPYIHGKHGSFHDQLFGIAHAQNVPQMQAEQFPMTQQSPGYHGSAINMKFLNSQDNMPPMMKPEAVGNNFDYSHGSAGLNQQNFNSQDQSIIANGGSFMSTIHDSNIPNNNEYLSQTAMGGSFSSNGVGPVDPSFSYAPDPEVMNPHTPVGFERSRKRSATPSSLNNSGVKRLHGESPLKSGYYSASPMIDAENTPTYISTKQEPSFQGPDKHMYASRATGDWVARNSAQMPQMNQGVQGNFAGNTVPFAPPNTMDSKHELHPTTNQMHTLNPAYGHFLNTRASMGRGLTGGSHEQGQLGDAIWFDDSSKHRIHPRSHDIDVKPHIRPRRASLYNTTRREPLTEPAPRRSRKQGLLIEQPRRKSRDRRSVPIGDDSHLRGIYTTPHHLKTPPQARRLKHDRMSPTLSNTSRHRSRSVSVHYSTVKGRRSKSRALTPRDGSPRLKNLKRSSPATVPNEDVREEMLVHEKTQTETLAQESASSASSTPNHVTGQSPDNETARSTPGTLITPLEVAMRRGYKKNAHNRKKSQTLKSTHNVKPSTPRHKGHKADEPIDLCSPEISPVPIDNRPMKERLTPAPKVEPKNKLGANIFGRGRILKKVAEALGLDPSESEDITEAEKAEDARLKEQKRQKSCAAVITKKEEDAEIAEIFGASEICEDKKKERMDKEFRAYRAKSVEASKRRQEIAVAKEREKLRLQQEKKEKERLEKEKKNAQDAKRRAKERAVLQKAEDMERDNRRRRATQIIEEDRAKKEAAQQAKELEKKKATEVQVEKELVEQLKAKQEELKRQSSNFKIRKAMPTDDFVATDAGGDNVEMANELFVEDKPAGEESNTQPLTSTRQRDSDAKNIYDVNIRVERGRSIGPASAAQLVSNLALTPKESYLDGYRRLETEHEAERTKKTMEERRARKAKEAMAEEVRAMERVLLPRPRIVPSSAQSSIAPACERCRSKKQRCDRIRPCCSQFSNVGLECKTGDKLSRGEVEVVEEAKTSALFPDFMKVPESQITSSTTNPKNPGPQALSIPKLQPPIIPLVANPSPLPLTNLPPSIFNPNKAQKEAARRQEKNKRYHETAALKRTNNARNKERERLIKVAQEKGEELSEVDLLNQLEKFMEEREERRERAAETRAAKLAAAKAPGGLSFESQNPQDPLDSDYESDLEEKEGDNEEIKRQKANRRAAKEQIRNIAAGRSGAFEKSARRTCADDESDESEEDGSDDEDFKTADEALPDTQTGEQVDEDEDSDTLVNSSRTLSLNSLSPHLGSFKYSFENRTTLTISESDPANTVRIFSIFKQILQRGVLEQRVLKNTYTEYSEAVLNFNTFVKYWRDQDSMKGFNENIDSNKNHKVTVNFGKFPDQEGVIFTLEKGYMPTEKAIEKYGQASIKEKVERKTYWIHTITTKKDQDTDTLHTTTSLHGPWTDLTMANHSACQHLISFTQPKKVAHLDYLTWEESHEQQIIPQCRDHRDEVCKEGEGFEVELEVGVEDCVWLKGEGLTVVQVKVEEHKTLGPLN